MKGFLTDFVGGVLEHRAAPTASPQSFIPGFLEEILTGMWGADKANLMVTDTSALTLSAVWACVRCLMEDCAKIPVKVVRRVGDNVYEPVENHPLNYLLNVSPDDEMSAFDFRSAMIMHAALQGNGISFLTFGGNGYVKKLQLAMPEQVSVRRSDTNGRIVYDHMGDRKSTNDIDNRFVAHVKGPTRDGLVGLSVVQTAKRSWGVAQAMQNFGSTFYANAGRPSMILSAKGKPVETQRKTILESLQKQTTGGNLGKPLILWDDFTALPMTMPLEDAQFIQTLQATVPDICRWFRVPPHKIQDLTRSTFSNIEQQEIGYVRDGLMPWFVRIEQEIARKCLERGLELMHEDAELTRGDMKSRMDSAAIALQWGLMTRNEWRRTEGLAAVEGGDTIMVPANQMNLAAAVDQTPGQANAQPGQDGNAANLASGNRSTPAVTPTATIDAVLRSCRAMLEERCERLLEIEENRTARLAKGTNAAAAIAEFRAQHRDHVRGVLGAFTEMVTDLVDGPLAGTGVRLATTLADTWMAMPAPAPDARKAAAGARTNELIRTLRTACAVLLTEGAPDAPGSPSTQAA